MSEFEILTYCQSATMQQIVVLGQLVGLHFAVIAGAYYFVSGSGWRMRAAAFAFYSLAYVMYLGILVSEGRALLSCNLALAELAADTDLSPLGTTTLGDGVSPRSNIGNLAATMAVVAAWFGASYFLLFWRRPDGR